MRVKMAAMLNRLASARVSKVANRFGIAARMEVWDRVLKGMGDGNDEWLATCNSIAEDGLSSYDNCDFEEARREKLVGKAGAGNHITTIQTVVTLEGRKSMDAVDDVTNVWKPDAVETYSKSDFDVTADEQEAADCFRDALFLESAKRVMLSNLGKVASAPGAVAGDAWTPGAPGAGAGGGGDSAASTPLAAAAAASAAAAAAAAAVAAAASTSTLGVTGAGAGEVKTEPCQRRSLPPLQPPQLQPPPPPPPPQL